MPMIPIISLKKHQEKRLKAGHLWVFSNELTEIPKDIPAGAIVEVRSSDGRSFGSGFFNPNSLIAVRLLGENTADADTDFFIPRFQRAFSLRKRLFPDESSFRLIFGESDFLPGLIVDKYADYFSIQTLSAGMDARIPAIISALSAVFPQTLGIVEKNASHLRTLEGLEKRESLLFGEIPAEIEMCENGLRYAISLMEGQKTGYFLDQKINRRALGSLVRDMRVLDCFSNQGGFALNAAGGGADFALGLDVSESATAAARKNAMLNGLNNVEFQTADVFEFLRKEQYSGAKWDCIVLDPPAFAKSKKSVPSAKKGYAEINRLALKLLPKGGLLATGSCSHHIFEETFWEILCEQAERENRRLRLIFRGLQSPDHPILSAMPETQYLKFFVVEVQ